MDISLVKRGAFSSIGRGVGGRGSGQESGQTLCYTDDQLSK